MRSSSPHTPFRRLVTFAISGGWGVETPTPGHIPVRIIRGMDFACIRQQRFDDIPRRYERIGKVAKRALQVGDVVLEISGGSRARGQSTGRSLLVTQALLDRLGEPVIPASFCRLIRFQPDRIDPGYAARALEEMVLSGRAARYENQSTGISNFQFDLFLDLEQVRLPAVEQQRRIADFFDTFDARIASSRRILFLLDEMIRTLFRSWCARLLSEPVGGPLGALAENVREAVAPHELAPETPAVGLEHMPRRNLALAEWGRAGDVQSGKWRFRRGDILFGQLRPYFHKVGVAPVDGVCSTDILVVRPRSPAWFGFVLGHLCSDALIRSVSASSSGTRMPRTSWGQIARFPVVRPSEVQAAAWTEAVEPLVEGLARHVEQVRRLNRVRDVLLPRVMSGALSVGEAEAGP